MWDVGFYISDGSQLVLKVLEGYCGATLVAFQHEMKVVWKLPVKVGVASLEWW